MAARMFREVYLILCYFSFRFQTNARKNAVDFDSVETNSQTPRMYLYRPSVIVEFRNQHILFLLFYTVSHQEACKHYIKQNRKMPQNGT